MAWRRLALPGVMPGYRCNSMLSVSEGDLEELPPEMRSLGGMGLLGGLGEMMRRIGGLLVGQQAGVHATEVGQDVAAGRRVRRHLCDPPDDQPELPDDPPPQLLLLPPLPPLVKRAPGELAPVAAMTTIRA